MNKIFPVSTVFLAVLTIFASTLLATYLHGFPFATVTIQELRTYGGADLKSLSDGSIWRLATAQLVHVKQLHMLFNVLSLLCLGSVIEGVIGRLNVLLLWLIAGACGVATSIYFSAPPFDVGTGASQAIFGFIAVSLLVIVRGHHLHRWFKASVIIISVLLLALDFLSVHYPKPGHMIGFAVGLLLSLSMVPKRVHQ